MLGNQDYMNKVHREPVASEKSKYKVLPLKELLK